MEQTPPDPETLFLDLLTTSVTEARETGQIVSSPHEAYALLLEKLEAYWREVRNHRDPEVLLDLLVALATQCVTAADDLFVKQVIGKQFRGGQMIKVWTKKELARAIELRLQGLKWAEIAERLGRSESAMWVKLSKFKISVRANGRDEEEVRENLVKLHHELLQASFEEETKDTPPEEIEPAQPSSPGPPPSWARCSPSST